MTYHRIRTRSQNLPPSPTMAKLHSKLARIISRQDQLKVSFNHLKSQIKIGLLEAEDVFSSLAVPLMKLVGLKSAEMAEEGRSSTIFTKFSSQSQPQDKCKDMIRVDTRMPLSSAQREYEVHKLEEDYTSSAIIAGKELIQKQKFQLIQLVQLLKQVENCVNANQNNMFLTINDHKDNIHKIFQKAVTYVSIIQQSSHDGSSFTITLKLLKAIYDHICTVFSSVENGIHNLVNNLTDQMCKPMIEYVKSVKAEMTTGTCPRLLVALEDMREAERDGRVELEQTQKRVKLAEERKLEALKMLKESEERIKNMKEYLGFVTDDKKESTGHYTKNKLLAPQDDQTKDDKLLWELLKKKRIRQQPESPFGPEELLPVGTSSTKHKKPTRGKPSIIIQRPSTRSYAKNKPHSLDSLLPLGSSPSVTTTKHALARKHVSGLNSTKR